MVDPSEFSGCISAILPFHVPGVPPTIHFQPSNALVGETLIQISLAACSSALGTEVLKNNFLKSSVESLSSLRIKMPHGNIIAAVGAALRPNQELLLVKVDT